MSLSCSRRCWLCLISAALAGGSARRSALRFEFHLVAATELPAGHGRYVTFQRAAHRDGGLLKRSCCSTTRDGRAQYDAGDVPARFWPPRRLYSSSLQRPPYQVYNVPNASFVGCPPSVSASRTAASDIVHIEFSMVRGPRQAAQFCGDGVRCTSADDGDLLQRSHRQAKVPLVSDAEAVDLDCPTLSRWTILAVREPAGYRRQLLPGRR